MTSQPVEAYPRLSARRWVPFAVVVGLFVAANIAVGVVGALAPEPHGHWTGHLTNAAIDIGMIVVVAVGTTLAWRRFGHLVVKLFAGAALATVMTGLVIMTVGNLRVARSIWRTPYGDEQVDQIGSGFSGFDSGHELQANDDLWVLLGGLVFALVLGFSKRVGVLAAAAGVVLSLSLHRSSFPPAGWCSCWRPWCVRGTSETSIARGDGQASRGHLQPVSAL